MAPAADTTDLVDQRYWSPSFVTSMPRWLSPREETLSERVLPKVASYADREVVLRDGRAVTPVGAKR